jgi:DNA (cytosine-5)-methyltransferase 1
MAVIRAADLFCGAGGSSSGLAMACEEAGRKLRLLAVNHWPVAIDTHQRNHPKADHLCETLDSIDPEKATGGKLDILIASPECTHHSNARGGKPRSDQSRASAWHVVRWAAAMRPKAILVENVREMLTWGPLDERGGPLKRRKGETFRAWVAAIRSLGYAVDYRVLNAADYGDPTTRQRLFVAAVRGKGPVPWPEPTHARDPSPGLFGALPRWRAARDVIDWSFPSASVFGRKRPLRPNTIKRIAEGIRRFWGVDPEPFLVMLYGTGTARDVDRPVPTVTAGGGHVGLCEPFIVPTNFGEREGQRPRTHSIDAPYPTVTGTCSHAVVQPFVVNAAHSPKEGERPRVNDLAEPLPTVTGSNSFAVVQPFVLGQQSGAVARPVDEPLPTISTSGAISVTEPFMVTYYSTGGPLSVDEPLRTVTTRERFGLVLGDGRRMDVRFRMLQPHELAAAMSFPAGYQFAGNRAEVVKQIGNAVPVSVARALMSALVRHVA